MWLPNAFLSVTGKEFHTQNILLACLLDDPWQLKTQKECLHETFNIQRFIIINLDQDNGFPSFIIRISCFCFIATDD